MHDADFTGRDMGSGHASASAVPRRVEEHILKLASEELHFELKHRVPGALRLSLRCVELVAAEKRGWKPWSFRSWTCPVVCLLVGGCNSSAARNLSRWLRPVGVKPLVSLPPVVG